MPRLPYHKYVGPDERNSRSPSPVAWERSQCAQDESKHYWHQEKARDLRQECEEVGLEGEYLSDSTDGDVELHTESESGSTTGQPASYIREIKRPGERDPVQLTLLGSTVIAGISGSFKRGERRLVRETVSFINTSYPREEIERIVSSLQRRHTFFAISLHLEPYEHYHIIHACPWKWYCCRCYQPTGGKRSLRTTELGTLTGADWTSELEYLCTDPRRLQYLFSGSTMSKSLRGIKLLFDEGVRDNSTEQPLENRQGTSEDSSHCTGDAPAAVTDRHVVGSNSQFPKSARRPKPEEVEQFIIDNACTPLTAIVKTTIWQGSKFRFLSARSTPVVDVMNAIRARISHWTYKDFLNYYDNHSMVIWRALNGNVNDYYFDVDESVNLLDRLIQYQFYDYACAQAMTTDEMTKQFLQEMFDLCEKKQAKKNGIEIIGPASSGKSLLVETWFDFYLSVGAIRNFNRYENFPLQSANNNRINLWNEACCDHAGLETAKLLIGGDPCPAKIKYEDDVIIARTPVFITANQRMIPNTKPFNDRFIARYHFKAAPFLIEYKKKPHPLCIPLLYEKYEVNLE